jgi:membrane-bound ClpP family serine protease
MLPVQLIGVVLLLASVGFFVLELLHPGVGLPAIAGVVCILLGGWFLFDSSVPGVQVSPLVIVPVAALAAFFFLVVCGPPCGCAIARSSRATRRSWGSRGPSSGTSGPWGS